MTIDDVKGQPHGPHLAVTTLSPGDSGWPPGLDDLADRPDPLFVRGESLDPAAHHIAIVGTRRPTLAGLEVAGRLARGLAEGGFVVVSGLAVGIDAAAHKGALDAGGTTVAVIGCGLDIDYPKRNRALRRRIEEHGTVVSEYEQGQQPMPFNFIHRNRIVAALADATIVVEGAINSGALITARRAHDLNRSVFAVPGSLRNPMAAGPNHLIKTAQASLVTSFKDVCDELAPRLVWEAQAKGAMPVSEDEAAVLAALDDAPAVPDKLASAIDIPRGRIALALSRLEVRGWALRTHAGYALSESGARHRC